MERGVGPLEDPEEIVAPQQLARACDAKKVRGVDVRQGREVLGPDRVLALLFDEAKVVFGRSQHRPRQAE